MFRYFGFHWNPAVPAETLAARQFEEAVVHSQGWRIALSGSGLRVFTIGHRSAVNGVYPLLPDQGVILGRLFRRKVDQPASKDVTLSASEAARILDSNGQALVDDYWGRYVAVIRSPGQCTLLLRDPSGTLPCYLRKIEGISVFFSWLEDLIAFAPNAATPRVNWGAISALMSLGSLGGEVTALEGVSQVLPGRLTALDEVSPASPPLWSALAFARRRREPEFDSAAAELRRVVMDCVQAWSSCYESILLRLSGGVDSAIVLGSLDARSSATQVTCLNYHSYGSDGDERGFARLAAGRAGVELIERKRDASHRLDNILSSSRMPSPTSYIGRMDTSRIDAEVAAASNAPALFTGSGGDQLFFQQRCTWPAADYFSVHGFGRGFIDASMDAARLARVSIWASMRRAVADQRRANIQLDDIGQFFKLARPEALEVMLDASRYVHPDLGCTADLPIGKLNHLQDLIDAPGYYDPYLAEAAPELVNPLISQPLIELCLALPTWLLTRGGRGRALARRAFVHDIPREIANRQSKGGMEELITAILRGNLPLTQRLLLDGHLVRQGLLDRGKVEAVLSGRLSGVGAYLGEIHHYVAIEAWLLRFTGSPCG